MASNTNNGLLSALRGPWPLFLLDGIFIGAGQTSQATAQAVLRSGANRIQVCPAGGAVLLPSMANGDEAADIVFVVNDGANAVLVFCDPGETMNGTLNGSLSVAAGAFGVFLARSPNIMFQMQSVPAITSTYDWRAAVIT
jgi:hypothetical protein